VFAKPKWKFQINSTNLGQAKTSRAKQEGSYEVQKLDGRGYRCGFLGRHAERLGASPGNQLREL
jgi:hypothetical protein